MEKSSKGKGRLAQLAGEEGSVLNRPGSVGLKPSPLAATATFSGSDSLSGTPTRWGLIRDAVRVNPKPLTLNPKSKKIDPKRGRGESRAVCKRCEGGSNPLFSQVQ